MKNRFSKVFFLLVCASMLCAVLCAALADDAACSHQYASVERPAESFAATCKEGGGYYVIVTCSGCGGYINKYKQYDSSPDPSSHQLTTNTTSGECGNIIQTICTLCGYTTEDTSNANHAWHTVSYTAQRCDEDSYSYEECTKCGLQRNRQTSSKVFAHTFNKNAATVTRQPTCGTTGETTQVCDCGQETRKMPIAATGKHNYGATQTIAGDCSKNIPEKTYQTCETCGYQSVLSQSVKHSLVTVTTPATCTAEGLQQEKCSVSGCSYVKMSYPLKALGHSVSWQLKDSSTHQSVCTRPGCGAVVGSGSHTPNKQNPLCTDRVYCTVCFGELRAASKHASSVVADHGDGTNHDLACPTCGYVTGRAKHTYVYVGGNCTNNQVCTVCGHAASGNSSHALSSVWTGVAGGHARKCTTSGCSYMVSEEHTWGDWYVAYEPTTTNPGTEATRCTKCSAIMTRSIPKLTATAAPQATATPSLSDADSTVTNPPADSGSASTQTNPPADSGSANTQTNPPADSGSASTQTNPPAASGSASTQTNPPVASGSTNAQTNPPAVSGSTNTQTNPPAVSGSTNTQTNPPAVSGSTNAQTNPPAVSGSTNAQTNPPTASGSANTQTNPPAASGSTSSAPTSAPVTGSTSNTQTNPPATANTQTAVPTSGAVNTETSAPTAGTVPPTDAATAELTSNATAAPVEHTDAVTESVHHAATRACADLDRDCSWEEFLQGGLQVRVCTLCGDVSAIPLFGDATAAEPVFQTITGVVVTGPMPANGTLVLRAANLTDTNGASSDAYAAISAVWESDGASVQLEDAVEVSMPLTIGEASDDGALTAPTADFRLVRVDVSNDEARLEEWTDIDFTYEDGILTFAMEKSGIYLLIPA